MTETNAYAKAGVDIAAGNEAVAKMSTAVSATYNEQVVTGLGGFGAAFALGSGYHDPVLITGADGVGTKLLLAIAANEHQSIGQDLVGMVMNDILAQGAKPLFLLDYLAVDKMRPDTIAEIVTGVAKATAESGAALIGGETAEMPGLYADHHYDLAAFAVGIAEREDLLQPSDVREGDVLIGLPSSGIHSNGYSLVRHVLGIGDDTEAFRQLDPRLKETLLTPTKLYGPAVLPLLTDKNIVSMAHITGGGLTENLPRAYGEHLSAQLHWGSWPRLPIFDELQAAGNLSLADMLRTFNNGLGMVLIVRADKVETVMTDLQARDEPAFVIGEMIAKADESVIYQGDAPWGTK